MSFMKTRFQIKIKIHRRKRLDIPRNYEEFSCISPAAKRLALYKISKKALVQNEIFTM